MRSALEWAASADVLSGNERAVLVALSTMVNRASAQAQVSRSALSLAARVSEATVKRCLYSMAARGLIAITVNITDEGDMDVAIYTLTGWLSLRGVNEPQKQEEVGAQRDDGLVTLHRPSVLCAPTPIIKGDTTNQIPRGSGGAKRRSPETTIPDGFPDAAALEAGRALTAENGRSNIALEFEAKKFRNHAIQNERRCRAWPAAWRNWLLSAIERAGGPVAVKAEDWPKRLSLWREHGDWNPSLWGPRPNEAGYRGPPVNEPTDLFKAQGGAA